MVVGLQDAVHVVVGGAVETLRHLALHRSISEGVHDVVHGGELTLASPLGALPEFVPVVLDLRLVPQRHLGKREENTGGLFFKDSGGEARWWRRGSHLCADLLGQGGAQVGRGVLRQRAGPRLHGNQLHLVGLTTGSIRRTAGQPVYVVEDGGRGQKLFCSTS